MGVTLSDAGTGAGIVTVSSGSPAAKAGLVAGDIIVAIDGHPTADVAGLAEVLAKLAPGDVARVSVQHQDGTLANLTVTLGQLPG